MAITCICIIVVAAGPKREFIVSSRTTTYFSYDKTAKYRLVEDHERRSKDGHWKTTTDGEMTKDTRRHSTIVTSGHQIYLFRMKYIFCWLICLNFHNYNVIHRISPYFAVFRRFSASFVVFRRLTLKSLGDELLYQSPSFFRIFANIY